MKIPSHGLQHVKVVALAVTDLSRAQQFYGEILGLPPAYEGGVLVGYSIGETALMLKENWYSSPNTDPTHRSRFSTAYAPDTAAFLKARNVTIIYPVEEIEYDY